MSKSSGMDTPIEYLLNAPLPPSTDTYTAIGYKDIIGAVKEQLKEREFTIVDEMYKANMNAQIAIGVYTLTAGDDPDIGMMFAWQSSYNKQIRFGCSVGAYVRINGAFFFTGDMKPVFSRKHTGNANDELNEMIEDHLKHAFETYRKLVHDKNQLKEKYVRPEMYSSMVGDMFINQKLITSEQLNVMAKEKWKPSFDYEVTDNAQGEYNAWTAYCHMLQAMLKCHPAKWITQQRDIHAYILQVLSLEITDQSEPAEEKTEEKTEEEFIEKDHRMGFAGGEKEEKDMSDGDPDKETKPFVSREEGAELRAEKKEEKEQVTVNGKPLDIKINLPESVESKHQKKLEAEKKEEEKVEPVAAEEKTEDNPSGAIFKSIGKLNELFPGFTEGAIINVKGVDYKIAGMTIQHTVAGHWLVPADTSADNSVEETPVQEASEVIEEAKIPVDNPEVKAAPVQETTAEEVEEIPKVIPKEEDDEFDLGLSADESANTTTKEEEPIVATIDGEEQVVEEQFPHDENGKIELGESDLEWSREQFDRLYPTSGVGDEVIISGHKYEVIDMNNKVVTLHMNAKKINLEVSNKEEEPEVKPIPMSNLGGIGISPASGLGADMFAIPEDKKGEKETDKVGTEALKIQKAEDVKEPIQKEEVTPEIEEAMEVAKEKVPTVFESKDKVEEAKAESKPAVMMPADKIEILNAERTDEEEDDVRAVIAKELKELYQRERQFTYEETTDHFHITLDTEETISLTKGYINKQILEHRGEEL